MMYPHAIYIEAGDIKSLHIAGTKQQLFDYVVGHIAKQGEKAVAWDERVGEDVCVYYDPETQHACAIGSIHPIFHDINCYLLEHTDSEQLGAPVSDLLQTAAREDSPYIVTYDDTLARTQEDFIQLLHELQYAHDFGYSAKSVQVNYKAVAEKYGLDATSVDAIVTF